MRSMSEPVEGDSHRIGVVKRKILEWYGENARDYFPWREEPVDAFHTLVFEMLVHQTFARKIVPVYLTLVERYPTPDSTSSSPGSNPSAFMTSRGSSSEMSPSKMCVSSVPSLPASRLARRVSQKDFFSSAHATVTNLPFRSSPASKPPAPLKIETTLYLRSC